MINLKQTFVALGAMALLNNAFAISEINYKEEFQKEIIPILNALETGTFQGEKNIPIFYATYTSTPQSTSCVVMLPGRTEAVQKYAEVIHSLDTGKLAGHFSFFLMDHRGQGSSGRMLEKILPTDDERSHVDNYNNYVLDLKTFMDQIVAKKNCSEKLLIAHSMGGGIGIKFLQEYPDYFSKAAFSSPMLKIQTSNFPYVVAKAIVKTNILLGKKEQYSVDQKPYDPTRDFEKNTFTTSEVRYEMAKDIFDNYPKTRSAGVTNGWLNQVMKATDQMRKNYDKIKIPVRVFYAGLEYYVVRDEAPKFCNALNECKSFFLETSKHEVLMDRDINRDVVISEIIKFFAPNL